jgi:hypothetical protein
MKRIKEYDEKNVLLINNSCINKEIIFHEKDCYRDKKTTMTSYKFHDKKTTLASYKFHDSGTRDLCKWETILLLQKRKKVCFT